MTSFDELLSGNSFHYKVVNHFRQNKWKVVVSPYYSDAYTNKPREIDLIATKIYPVKSFMGREIGYLALNLFVECKYINQKTLFWFDEKDRDRAMAKVLKIPYLRSDSICTNQHHYLDDCLVAKLFDIENGQKDTTNESRQWAYQAINQCLNAYNYFLNEPIENSNEYLASLNYPLIICNNFEKFSKIRPPYEKQDSLQENFQMEINYTILNNAGGSRNEYFLLDMVSFQFLDHFLNELDRKDVTPMKELISLESDRGKQDFGLYNQQTYF